MAYTKITAFSMIIFFVMGAFTFASTNTSVTPTVASSEDDSSSTSADSTEVQLKVDSAPKLATTKQATTKQAATKQATIKQKPLPEPETIIAESEVVEVSPIPSHVYSNRSYRSYNVQQIRNMPMVARPDRPGHFIGNTVRAFYRGRRGR